MTPELIALVVVMFGVISVVGIILMSRASEQSGYQRAIASHTKTTASTANKIHGVAKQVTMTPTERETVLKAMLDKQEKELAAANAQLSRIREMTAPRPEVVGQP